MPGFRIPNLAQICINLQNADEGLVDERVRKMLLKAGAALEATQQSMVHLPKASKADTKSSAEVQRFAGDRKSSAEDTKSSAEIKDQKDTDKLGQALIPPALPKALEIIASEGGIESFLKGDTFSTVVFKYSSKGEEKTKLESKGIREAQAVYAVHFQFMYISPRRSLVNSSNPGDQFFEQPPMLCMQIFMGEGIGNNSTVNTKALNAIMHRHHWMDIACYETPIFKGFQLASYEGSQPAKNIYAGVFFGIELESIPEFWLDQFCLNW